MMNDASLSAPLNISWRIHKVFDDILGPHQTVQGMPVAIVYCFMTVSQSKYMDNVLW